MRNPHESCPIPSFWAEACLPASRHNSPPPRSSSQECLVPLSPSTIARCRLVRCSYTDQRPKMQLTSTPLQHAIVTYRAFCPVHVEDWLPDQVPLVKLWQRRWAEWGKIGANVHQPDWPAHRSSPFTGVLREGLGQSIFNGGKHF